MPTDTTQYTLFFVVWSLKEAFIKAIGLGLGFDLTKVGEE
jgi:phosphopantetheinyl transferase